MIHTRRLWALSALLVSLVLGACSTPDDLNAPTLEPQFGTADEDRGVDVAFLSTGRIYSLSEQTGAIYEGDNGDGTYYQNGNYKKALLRRYDGSGRLTWMREVDSESCNWDDPYYYENCKTLRVLSLATNSQGYVYVLMAKNYTAYNGGYDPEIIDYYVRKYNATGNLVSSTYVNEIVAGPEGNGGEYWNSTAFGVDSNGNIYATGGKCEYLWEDDVNIGYLTGANCTPVVSKYSSTGSMLWTRPLTVGISTGITVSGSGSVYVVGPKGMARYSSTGTLAWTKPGNFEQVMISGSNLYTRYRKDIRKYDGNGKQLWYKAQSGLKTLVIQDMHGDGNGNVYLSGKYEVYGPDWNAMTRKLNSSGSVLWTKTYGTSGFYDDAKGIATINGSEIYTTGLTKGSLAHPNIGGEDGYLRKVNSTGNPVWTR